VVGTSRRPATAALFDFINMNPRAMVAPGEVTSTLTRGPSLMRLQRVGSAWEKCVGSRCRSVEGQFSENLTLNIHGPL
jgi:hypothetical protein